MAVRANFYGGPLNGEWRAMQEPVSALRVSVQTVTGIYKAKEIVPLSEGVWRVEYEWRGWEMQEVQESKGSRVE